ncbi:lycopene cyclase domain-containing protein [Paramicrobacterium agarici]|uniref:Lycopene cyclase domain-containing protein n=1 Tax=Paramicrobacterium agarici TaxID=630514 RepID=A0A2A9DWX2_9MICO|nr:lycopene cyclase domain-containing protein [Microbacterium agarici]PFG30635.1 lycopene cyclase domain-containing protein [Microbacterium agarici]
MTYSLMSVPFSIVAVGIFAVGGVRAHRTGCGGRYLASWAITVSALVALTLIFDNIMMAAGFFDYGTSQISGLRIGLIPAEDLLYPLAGSLFIAGLSSLISPERRDRDADI